MLDERRRKDVRNEIVWTATAVVGLALALILPPRLAITLGLLLAVVSFVALGFSLSNSEACDINASCPTSERVAEWIDEGLFFPARRYSFLWVWDGSSYNAVPGQEGGDARSKDARPYV